MEADRRVPKGILSETRRGAIVTIEAEGGREYRGRIVALDGDEAQVRLFEELPFRTESPLEIALVQAVPKRERMELIVQKATELGVSELFPCMSERSTAPGPQDKSHRWSAIARKAVEQCRRKVVPPVNPCADLEEALSQAARKGGIRLVLYEKEGRTTMRDLTERPPGGRPSRVVIACGPEGGFTEGEISMAAALGFLPVSLGGRVLRCETAALAAISIIQHEWGDL